MNDLDLETRPLSGEDNAASARVDAVANRKARPRARASLLPFS